MFNSMKVIFNASMWNIYEANTYSLGQLGKQFYRVIYKIWDYRTRKGFIRSPAKLRESVIKRIKLNKNNEIRFMWKWSSLVMSDCLRPHGL